jgi:hypothetical protein
VETYTKEKNKQYKKNNIMDYSKNKDEKYDAKMAYNKNLTPKARMHYLENNIADHNAPKAYGTPNHMKGSYGPDAYGQPHMDGKPHMKGQPHMESNKQEKYNLMHDNPVAKHGSFLSKHMKG